MRRIAFSHHVAGHHRIYAEGGYDPQEYAYRYLYGLKTLQRRIRKSRFSEVHVARADTTSGSLVAVAIPSYPSIQSDVLLRPGVNAAGVLCPGPYK
jgi:cystathionine beta-lyase/cystathionine gamma-synthase